VILSDISSISGKTLELVEGTQGLTQIEETTTLPFRFVDVMDENSISKAVVECHITHIIHLTSILSANGELRPKFATQLNMRGIENVLEVAARHNLSVFAPSSIAAFGPNIDLENVGDDVMLRPHTIYGVSKVYLELIGEYYHTRYGIDFRSLRLPGVISYKSMPGGGTTDYAVDIFYKVKKPNSEFTCFLNKDTMLPMMYMSDCIGGIVKFIETDTRKLKRRTYNIAAVSFTPEMLANEINSQLRSQNKPPLKMIYQPDFRNKIALSWPRLLNDENARQDWDWNHSMGIPEIVKDMLLNIKQ
jgi:threonine 3-dehydrogenase